MPWPLEQLVRQYIGFNTLVCREYSDLIYYRFDDRLVAKRFDKSIAQWRKYPSNLEEFPYIYHFRYIFVKNYVIQTYDNEIISLPPKLYIDIVKRRYLG